MMDLYQDNLEEILAKKLCELDHINPDEYYELWYRDPWPNGETVVRYNWEDYIIQAQRSIMSLREIENGNS